MMAFHRDLSFPALLMLLGLTGATRSTTLFTHRKYHLIPSALLNGRKDGVAVSRLQAPDHQGPNGDPNERARAPSYARRLLVSDRWKTQKLTKSEVPVSRQSMAVSSRLQKRTLSRPQSRPSRLWTRYACGPSDVLVELLAGRGHPSGIYRLSLDDGEWGEVR